MLGDDALDVLKDLRRWIKLHDGKKGRFDAARVLAEQNLVKGDLLEILSSWSQSGKNNQYRTRIAVKCCKLSYICDVLLANMNYSGTSDPPHRVVGDWRRRHDGSSP